MDRSADARRAILGALRTAPPQPVPAPALPPPPAEPDRATLVDRFESAATGWRAEVLRSDAAGWPQVVRAVLERHGCRRVAIGDHGALRDALAGLDPVLFDRPLEQWKAEFFAEVDAGVTFAAAGAADSGTLLLAPGPAEPRSLSLVPPVHVAVLFASRLRSSLAAALASLRLGDRLPTNLVFASGPSKTADIQLTLAFGAHGPKVLAIVLVEDA